MAGNPKVKLSDVIAALQTIEKWTAAVRQELEDYKVAAGDIPLSTDVADAGTAVARTLSTSASGVGRHC